MTWNRDLVHGWFALRSERTGLSLVQLSDAGHLKRDPAYVRVRFVRYLSGHGDLSPGYEWICGTTSLTLLEAFAIVVEI